MVPWHASGDESRSGKKYSANCCDAFADIHVAHAHAQLVHVTLDHIEQ